MSARASRGVWVVFELAVPSDDQCLDHLAYSVVTTGLQLGVRVAGSVWLTVYGGRTVYRRFELFNAENAALDGGLQTIPNEWFVRSGLTWRLPID